MVIVIVQLGKFHFLKIFIKIMIFQTLLLKHVLYLAPFSVYHLLHHYSHHHFIFIKFHFKAESYFPTNKFYFLTNTFFSVSSSNINKNLTQPDPKKGRQHDQNTSKQNMQHPISGLLHFLGKVVLIFWLSKVIFIYGQHVYSSTLVL